MNYDCVIIFHKMTNLLPWFESKAQELLAPIRRDDPTYNLRLERIRVLYATPRNVRLILMVRYDRAKVYCKIQCPVSPLPVKGEFEVPSLSAIKYFLIGQGWNETEAIAANMLK